MTGCVYATGRVLRVPVRRSFDEREKAFVFEMLPHSRVIAIHAQIHYVRVCMYSRYSSPNGKRQIEVFESWT